MYYCFRSGQREIFANYFRRVDRFHHTIVACQRRVFIALGVVNSLSYNISFYCFIKFYDTNIIAIKGVPKVKKNKMTYKTKPPDIQEVLFKKGEIPLM